MEGVYIYIHTPELNLWIVKKSWTCAYLLFTSSVIVVPIHIYTYMLHIYKNQKYIYNFIFGIKFNFILIDSCRFKDSFKSNTAILLIN